MGIHDRLTVPAEDVGAILGLNPGRTALDVYSDLVFGAPPTADRDRVAAALEWAAMDVYRTRSGIDFAVVGVEKTTDPPNFATARAATLRDESGRLLAGSSVRVVPGPSVSVWRNGPPPWEVAAAQLAMAVFDCPCWDVVALLGGAQFSVKVYREVRDVELGAQLLAAVSDFVTFHVEPRNPPPAVPGDDLSALAARMFPRAEEPRWLQDHSDEAAAEMRLLREADDRLRIARAEYAAAAFPVKVRLGGHSGMHTDLGVVTWPRTGKKPGFHVRWFDREHIGAVPQHAHGEDDRITKNSVAREARMGVLHDAMLAQLPDAHGFAASVIEPFCHSRHANGMVELDDDAFRELDAIICARLDAPPPAES